MDDPKPRISSRIARGENGKPGELPFLVQIRYGNNYLCAGALIHGYHLNQVVLTTAECVTKPSGQLLNYDQMSIIGGKYHMDNTYFYEQVVVPSRIIRHEQWDRHNIINDLAVIFLKTQFELNALVHTIELPLKVKSSYPPNGYPLTVGAWGFIDDGKYSPVLQVFRLPTLEWQECYNWYLFHDNARHINRDSTLCGRDEATNGRKDLCHGDWGAPARAYDNGTEYLAGIFSWAEAPCGNNKFPSLFQKMTYFRHWVFDTSINDPYWGRK